MLTLLSERNDRKAGNHPSCVGPYRSHPCPAHTRARQLPDTSNFSAKSTIGGNQTNVASSSLVIVFLSVVAVVHTATREVTRARSLIRWCWLTMIRLAKVACFLRPGAARTRRPHRDKRRLWPAKWPTPSALTIPHPQHRGPEARAMWEGQGKGPGDHPSPVEVVETRRIELPTFALRTRRSPS